MRYDESIEDSVNGEIVKYVLRGVVAHEGKDRKSGHFRAFAKSGAKVWHMVGRFNT